MRDAYLARLGFASVEAPTKTFLARLQRAHVQTIPYENLDVLAGRPISLDVDDLFHKIIGGQRGGYCFELNTLFGWLLKALGYEVEFRMGRVWLRDPVDVPPRNHGTHVVQLDGQTVIADVGFGGRAPRQLLDIDQRDVPIDDGDAAGEPLRLVGAGEHGVMVQRFLDDRWANQFSLERVAAHASDLEVANHYQATASTSHFRHHLFVGRFRQDGRDGLFDTRLSRRYGSETVVETLTSLEQMEQTLREVFGIDPEQHRASLTKIMDPIPCA
ncbi:arylamine N-acetyltransferase family protein [Brevundimonas sp.]